MVRLKRSSSPTSGTKNPALIRAGFVLSVAIRLEAVSNPQHTNNLAVVAKWTRRQRIII